MPKFSIALDEADSHVCYFQHKHTFISQSAGKLVRNKKMLVDRLEDLSSALSIFWEN